MLVRGPSKKCLTSAPAGLKAKQAMSGAMSGEDSDDEEEISFGRQTTERDICGPARRKSLIVYHSSGMYQVSPSNGSYDQVSSEGWSRVKATAYDNDNTIYVFHDGGLFKMSVDSCKYTTLSSEGWFATTAAVYAQGSLIAFHTDGMFRVSTSDGSYEQISSESWSRVKAAAYDSDNTINIFHDGGIFQVRVDNGSYKTLSWRGWSSTTAAVYAHNGLIVFSSEGIFRVNEANGSYTKISSEAWSRVRAAAYDEDGTVHVFHDGGIFQVSVENGSYTMLSREGWSSTKAAVYTKGKVVPSPHNKEAASPKKATRSRGIFWATLLLVFVFIWAEYGPEVAFKWKVLRSCLAAACVLRLAMWSWSPTKLPNPSSPSTRKDAGNAHKVSAEKSEDDFQNGVESPMRAAFMPAGPAFGANTRQPVMHEDDASKLKILAMHRPTHEKWREDMGNYPYSWHFSGRKRLWEIRIQVRFKRLPTSNLYFGIEMRYIPFTLTTFVKYCKNILLKGMSSALGGEIYQTPGEDPDSLDGEAEPPTFALPMWAIDQFHVANPGEEPDLTGDLEGIGVKRTSGLKKYIQAFKAEMANLSTEKVYTFCLWGISPFADAINWEMTMGGFKLDANQLSGKPPIYVVIYEMPGVKPDDKDRRHLISRKKYYGKIAVWNSSKPFDEAEVSKMDIGNPAKGGESAITGKKSRVNGAADWFVCCGGRP